MSATTVNTDEAFAVPDITEAYGQHSESAAQSTRSPGQQLLQWVDDVGRRLPELSQMRTPPVVTNVGPRERVVSLVAGVPLVLLGARRRFGFNSLTLVGGEMLYRGLTGHCPVYQAVGIQHGNGLRSADVSVPRGEGVRVEASVEVAQKPKAVYDFWRRLDTLPQIMDHLVSVTVLDEQRSHWVAKAPAGQTVQWDAEIIHDEPAQLIGWRSLQGADIANAGSVHFEPTPDGSGTIVHVELEYVPPVGPLGAAVASLLGASPAQQIGADLERLKQVMAAGVPGKRPARSAHVEAASTQAGSS